MLATLALTLALAQGENSAETRTFYVGEPSAPTTYISYMIRDGRLSTSKKSPKQFGDPPAPFLFDWVVSGYGRTPESAPGSFGARFRVFSQQSSTHQELSPLVVRCLLRLWEHATQDLRIEHSQEINNRIVDVYLCFGGTPGGEQQFARDIENERVRTVNTIYIYDLPSFKKPIEMAREVCHEYGHAVIWPVGGFSTPEEWGNGVLGELIFMRALRDRMAAKQLGPEDTMGCSLAELDTWVKANTDLHVDAAAQDGPSTMLAENVGLGTMQAAAGLILFMREILPRSAFDRAIRMGTGPTAKASGLENSFETAVFEQGETVLAVSEARRKKPFWVPLGARDNVRSAQILKRKGNWAQIKVGAGVPTIVHKS